jgi:thiamine-phosphate diphosphorylase
MEKSAAASPAFAAADLRLCLITDDAGRPTGELAAIVEGALEGGVTAVQYREKSASASVVADQLRVLSPICRRRGAPLILNASLLDAALTAGCLGLVDGVHYGRETWPLRARLAPHLPAGYSAHEIEEARERLAEGAAYVTLSPIFDTPQQARHPAAARRRLAARGTANPRPRRDHGGTGRHHRGQRCRSPARWRQRCGRHPGADGLMPIAARRGRWRRGQALFSAAQARRRH